MEQIQIQLDFANLPTDLVPQLLSIPPGEADLGRPLLSSATATPAGNRDDLVRLQTRHERLIRAHDELAKSHKTLERNVAEMAMRLGVALVEPERQKHLVRAMGGN